MKVLLSMTSCSGQPLRISLAVLQPVFQEWRQNQTSSAAYRHR